MAILGKRKPEEPESPAGSIPNVNTEVCDVCGARYAPTAGDRCPNNNCPRHAP